MQSDRAFLTADWRNLAMLSYAVEPDLLRPIVPSEVELDEHHGQTYVTIVGFQFSRARLLGWRVPGHQLFAEVNLRFYVRRETAGELRRGVVFVKEIVSRRMVAWIANRAFHEHFAVRPLRHACRPASEAEAPSVEYRFRQGGRWHGLSLAADGPLPLAASADSVEEFIIEHYWGYSRMAGGATLEYRVAHQPWSYWPARRVKLDFDFAAVYGQPWAAALAGPPDSALLVDGSGVEVFGASKLAPAQADATLLAAR